MAKDSFWLDAEEWHTGGEPFRIVQILPPSYLDASLLVAEQRETIIRTPNHPVDLLRRTLCHEPRGHADMYGGFITPPNDDKAHFGVLFWHKDGFSTACGHGTIALGHWAIAHGLVHVEPETNQVDVVIDVPSGRVVARVGCEDGVVKHVDFVNVTSYQLVQRYPLKLQHQGEDFNMAASLSFAGAIYASVQARDLGLEVCPKNYRAFIDLQRQVREQMKRVNHQDKYELYGVCFFDHLSDAETWISQRNVVVFADGQVDRSPCGSGTCARLAALLAEGKVNDTKTLIHTSIINTEFQASIEAIVPSPTDYPACIPRVRGKAHLVARHQFYIDERDPVYPGFLFN